MNLKIWGAHTLKSFTDCISKGLELEGVKLDADTKFDAGVAQIHGSPQSVIEDKEILDESLASDFPIVYLIHRPDELLENLSIINTLARKPEMKFILLGDLVFRFPFWFKRKSHCAVIPHPFTDLTFPPPSGKCIVGSYTSWGEMRELDHYIRLVEAFNGINGFEFKIGGTGLDPNMIPSHIKVSKDFFVPHFNVQLYHLHGKKRFGETSGSLHRGISIPVIFEANGAERLENFSCIKIQANDDLTEINFKTACLEIQHMTSTNLIKALELNLLQAQSNSPRSFAKALLQILKNEISRR